MEELKLIEGTRFYIACDKNGEGLKNIKVHFILGKKFECTDSTCSICYVYKQLWNKQGAHTRELKPYNRHIWLVYDVDTGVYKYIAVGSVTSENLFELLSEKGNSFKKEITTHVSGDTFKKIDFEVKKTRHSYKESDEDLSVVCITEPLTDEVDTVLAKALLEV